jgi:hypothetical protein
MVAGGVQPAVLAAVERRCLSDLAPLATRPRILTHRCHWTQRPRPSIMGGDAQRQPSLVPLSCTCSEPLPAVRRSGVLHRREQCPRRAGACWGATCRGTMDLARLRRAVRRDASGRRVPLDQLTRANRFEREWALLEAVLLGRGRRNRQWRDRRSCTGTLPVSDHGRSRFTTDGVRLPEANSRLDRGRAGE